MRRKLGLETAETEDAELAQELLDVMERARSDFTLTFRHLALALVDSRPSPLLALFEETDEFGAWLDRWRARSAREGRDSQTQGVSMLRANPAFIPRNHLVEGAIQDALSGDHSTFEQLVDT